MNKEEVTKELSAISAEFGYYPYGFFNILHNSDNPNLDFDEQNKGWEFVKNEDWHNLDLSNYLLWSISDNGDLLWWNGSQTVALNPRGSEFISVPVNPKQFIRLVGMGKIGNIFPSQLWEENA